MFYDCEEVEAERNGLLRVSRNRPDLLQGDFAVLMEPTGALIEGGCQGTLRAEVTTRGKRAHSARSWMDRTQYTGPAGSSTCCGPTSPASRRWTGSSTTKG